MGYDTSFSGKITIEPPLNEQELKFFTEFQKNLNLYQHPDQPSDWFDWISKDGTTIEWSGGEKFYYPVEWMEFIINHFMGSNPIAKRDNPEEFSFLQSHTLNGTIEAQGEDEEDQWQLVVVNNEVSETTAQNPTEDY